MQFVKPMPFQEAIDKLGRQSPIGAKLSSKEWSDVPVQLRESAFFSANVEDVRFLQAMKNSLVDYLAANRKTLPDGQTMLATGSRAAFVDQMQKMLQRMGVERGDGSLKDITSSLRLGIIFDVKTQQAGDYGYWRQGLDKDVLNIFPAQRFIRVKDVTTPRPLHQANENVVRLKTDVEFWLAMNSPLIGGFGVPYGPWGFNSGMDVEDVDRSEAESLGLIKAGERLNTAPLQKYLDLNHNLQASAAGIEPELLDKLQQAFGDQIRIEGDVIRWNVIQDESQRQQPGQDSTQEPPQ